MTTHYLQYRVPMTENVPAELEPPRPPMTVPGVPVIVATVVFFVLLGIWPGFLYTLPLFVGAVAVHVRFRDQARLAHNAQVEHQMITEGDIQGVYGTHPPAAETRGMGIWIADKESNEQRGDKALD